MKRFYALMKLDNPPGKLTKIIKCVKYYLYRKFDYYKGDMPGMGIREGKHPMPKNDNMLASLWMRFVPAECL